MTRFGSAAPVRLGVLRLAAQPVLAPVTAAGCDIVRRAWSPEAFVWLRLVKLRFVKLRLSGVPDRLHAVVGVAELLRQ
jgi:hypothetical protein